jgi:hypothetical protein
MIVTINSPSYIARVNLVTPDLSWRGTEANNEWDSRRNWTLSIEPAHVHDVYIGAVNDNQVLTPSPDTTTIDLEIIGPRADTTIRSLTIGSEENARHELELQPGVTLTSLQNIQIEPSGILAGAGSLVTERLTNDGLIDIATTGSQFHISGDFLQSPDGVLRITIGHSSPHAVVDVSGDAVISGLVELIESAHTLMMQTGPWNLLTAQSIEIDAEIRFPRDYRVEIVTDPATLRQTLQMRAAPEPGPIALSAFPAIAGASLVRLRRRSRQLYLPCRIG